MADAMVASGMAAAGFQYINLDDCWMVERAANGSITPDPVRFPSGIKALADYIHSKGLKFGIYQAPGNPTPQGRPGLLNHEAQVIIDPIKCQAVGKGKLANTSTSSRRMLPPFASGVSITSSWTRKVPLARAGIRSGPPSMPALDSRCTYRWPSARRSPVVTGGWTSWQTHGGLVAILRLRGLRL